jgi:hypothetical protein
VRKQAAKIGSGIHGEISPAVEGFLLERRFVIVASVAPAGEVWASVLGGEPGFLETIDERRLRVHARPVDGDPLGDGLRDGSDIGLVAIDLVHRRRVRLNGRAERQDGKDGADGFDLITREVFGNCPKYIQARAGEGAPSASTPSTAPPTAGLDEAQAAWLRGADTFFIASRSGEAGADASHRGGNPGFVEVIDRSRIAWPDYSGNRMFQTLGNLATDPRAGLLFIDFEGGRTLQLTGRAEVDWDEKRAARHPGAERIVDFTIERVIETKGRSELRRRLVERSPFNPG